MEGPSTVGLVQMDVVSKPIDIPPFQLQRLIPDVIDHILGATSEAASGRIQVCCAQALGSEIYVGCSNGDLLRFSLQASEPNKLQSYTLLSNHRVPGDRPIEEIVIIPSLSKALVLSAHQIHFFSIPSLDPLPIKPIRHAVAFAVDDHHLKIPPPASSAAPAGVTLPVDAVDFCVIKRTGIALYTLKERLVYIREVPQISGALLAKRAGKTLCIADKAHYHIVDLQAMAAFPLLPISQAVDPAPFEVKPSITVVGPSEFLLLSWTGTSTLGLFVTGNGDPVRGTLEWSSHPEAICLDYPYITSLLPNDTIQIHSIETQTVIQVIVNASRSSSTPISSPTLSSPMTFSPHHHHRRSSSTSSKNVIVGTGRDVLSSSSSSRRVLDLISTSGGGGYVVPCTHKLDKIRKVPVALLRL